MDVLPLLKPESIKQEPNDTPLNFLYSDEKGTEVQKVGESKREASRGCIENLLTKNVVPSDSEGAAMAGSQEKRPDRLHNGDVFESSATPPRTLEPQPTNESSELSHVVEQGRVVTESFSADASSSLSLQSVCSTLNLFQPSIVSANAVLVSSPHGEVAGSCEGTAFDSLQTVISGIAIPVEELTPFEQLSIKTDEVFIHDNTNNGMAVTQVEDGPPLCHQEQIQTEPQQPPDDFVDGHTGPSGEIESQRPQPSLPLPEPNNARRMKRKTCERKRTMTTRTSTGSLPKACRVEASSEKILLKGMGVKVFNCVICPTSFSQRSLLQKHVLEVHQGKSSGSKAGTSQPPVSVTFACPLCNLLYKRTYGLKRHFASKHADAKDMSCPECNFKAKKLQSYLRHIKKHAPMPPSGPTPPDIPSIARDRKDSVQLKCFDCHQHFERRDALSIHVANHKIALSLSEAESVTSTTPPEKPSSCTCLSNNIRNSKSPTLCVLHSPSRPTSSGAAGAAQMTFDHLPQELKVTVEQSLDLMSKLSLRIQSLVGSISAGTCPDGGHSPLAQGKQSLLAMNHICHLSTQLTTLTTSIGNCLLNNGGQANSESPKAKDGKDESAADNGDTVELDSDSLEAEEANDIIGESGDEASGAKSEFVNRRNVDGAFAPERSEDIFRQKVGGEKEKRIKKERFFTNPPPPPPVVRRSKRSCAGARMKLKVKKEEFKSEPVEERQKNKHTCRACGKVLSDKHGLKRHMLIHRNAFPFRCTVCKRRFRRRDHLRGHMVKHSSDRPFCCEMCAYTAKTDRRLHLHALTHNSAKRLPCAKCPYKGRTPYELAQHENKHAPCSLCGYEAGDAADYKIHQRSHTSYSCTECDYSTHTRWQLCRHAKKHVREKGEDCGNGEQYCCELCGYACLEKRQFTYHMQRHQNKTPYSCAQCDYKCSSRASFDAHKLMHAGLRPYLCSICGASFRRTSNLNNHLLVHKEEKRHVCQTCGRPFRARHNLRMHEMTHTGEKHHKCHLCTFACRRNKELRMHKAKHHPEEEEEEEEEKEAVVIPCDTVADDDDTKRPLEATDEV